MKRLTARERRRYETDGAWDYVKAGARFAADGTCDDWGATPCERCGGAIAPGTGNVWDPICADCMAATPVFRVEADGSWSVTP